MLKGTEIWDLNSHTSNESITGGYIVQGNTGMQKRNTKNSEEGSSLLLLKDWETYTQLGYWTKLVIFHRLHYNIL